MAEKTIGKIVQKEIELLEKNGEPIAISVLHKLGPCPVGDTSLVICISTQHRTASFEICERILERLKLEVPIWKKEIYECEDVDMTNVIDGNVKEKIGSKDSYLWKENVGDKWQQELLKQTSILQQQNQES